MVDLVAIKLRLIQSITWSNKFSIYTQKNVNVIVAIIFLIIYYSYDYRNVRDISAINICDSLIIFRIYMPVII